MAGDGRVVRVDIVGLPTRMDEMEPLTDEELAQRQAIDDLIPEMREFIKDYFTQRELRLIRNCMEYADEDPAGLPGHNLMMLIVKLIRYHGGLLNVYDSLQEMIEMAEDRRE